MLWYLYKDGSPKYMIIIIIIIIIIVLMNIIIVIIIIKDWWMHACMDGHMADVLMAR